MDPEVKSVLTASVAANLCPTVLGQVSKKLLHVFNEVIIITKEKGSTFLSLACKRKFLR